MWSKLIPTTVWAFMVGLNVVLFGLNTYLKDQEAMALNVFSGLACYLCYRIGKKQE